MDKEGKVIQKLLEVYRNAVDDMSEPAVIGGGTYARAFPNAVAFGSEQPGISGPVHMPNEFIGIDELMFNAHMIADAIIALACEE